MNSQYIPILQSVITASVSLIIAIGTWVIGERAKEEERKTAMSKMKEDIMNSIDDNRDEYIKSINSIEKQILELQNTYQNTDTILSMKIDNLEKKQDKHNSLIERTFKLEQESVLQAEQIKVANNRILDLERHEESR